MTIHTPDFPHIMLTRPKALAEPLGGLLIDQDLEPVYFPTIQIVGQDHANIFENPHVFCHKTLFLSQHAVEHAAYLTHHQDRLGEIMAIGKSTANALEKQGFEGITLPINRFSSEGLLALPELQADLVKDQKILIVAGEEPRPLLLETLRERGAKCRLLEVYKRRCPHAKFAKSLYKYQPDTLSAMVFHSATSLYNFVSLAEETPFCFLDTPIVTVSERIQKIAKDLGFTHITVADVNPEVIVATLLEKVLCVA